MSKHSSDLNNLISHIALYDSESAYKQFFKYLFPVLYRFSYCLLKSKELSEEVASDVMITLWKNRKNLPELENVKVYALVIARNLSLNVLNKHSRHELVSIDDIEIEVALDSLNPEQLLINGELKKRLEQATQSLPDKCKMVFKLIKEDGLSYKETASLLNISVKTVDAHLVTALKKMALVLHMEVNLL